MSTASTLLSPSQLAIVRKRSDLRGLLAVGHAWVVIFGTMALVALFSNPLTYLLAIAIIGARQLGLAILMHDGAHGILTENPRLNNFLSQWLCAYPMLAETGAYRRYHLKHHAHTQQADDPDLILSAPFPITRKSFRRKMIRDLTGQTGYQQRKAQILNAWGGPELTLSGHLAHYWKKLGRATSFQLGLLVLLSLAGRWDFFFTLWLLPMLTWHQAITRIRNIAEHAMVDSDDPFRNARTTQTSFLERAFIAPYWVNYHVEHHLMMWVPCYNLPATRRFLIANGYGERMESKPNYWSVLTMATSRPDDEDKPGDLVHNARRRVVGDFNEGFSKPDAA
ncbi:MAG: fatty acid desaturase [Rhizobiales bacterium]|nr:fatty acid desaturase [Hyphomicrobiales bacterium]